MTALLETERTTERVREPANEKRWRNRFLIAKVGPGGIVKCAECGAIVEAEGGKEFSDCCATYPSRDDAELWGAYDVSNTIGVRYIGAFPVDAT